MKFLFATLVVNLAATASAFQVVRGCTQATRTTASTTSLDMSSHHLVNDINELSENRDEDILQALGSMEGPTFTYGHYAALEGKKPTDIKGTDNFDFFRDLVEQTGCAKFINGNGPYTVFAPTNSAIEAYDGTFDEETIKTHFIMDRDIFTDEFDDGTLETLSGHVLTVKRQFRKLYLDEALIGQLDNHSGGTPYPTNVICRNGVIHTINTVLRPGWKRAVADAQGVQGLALQSHLNQKVLKDRGALGENAGDRH
eukprot:CAMPEP_0176114610 /NCGR_PEP_ID=MMETSP0120_2-20121206/57555_1 /TAXON_ID=160619 /ORGANISM="Kryptoperidinium foliaceum, Strain CCMP 1326" /LENGTH=254 /DNA_ID=CAMNT_0017448843 /DNA_START=13 /DNA_END=777 /DNA_ORIENTATION=-